MARPIRVVTRLAGGIALVLLLGSLVLAWLTVRSGGSSDGFEIAAFIIYPLIAMVIASIAGSLLLLLGVLLEGALRVSGGRVLPLLVLGPLAVVPVVGLAVWPWTLGPPRAAALCRDEGGFRGTPLSVAGFLDTVSGRRDGWKYELAKRLLVDGYLFVEEPADVARERVRKLDSPDALRDFDDGEGDIVRYVVAPRNHEGCDLLPGLFVRTEDKVDWQALGLPSGACLAAERSDEPVSRYALRAAREYQFRPTYVRWDEIRIVDLESGDVAARFRAFGPPLDVGEGLEDVTSLNPLRVIRAYLAPRTPCGDKEKFLDEIASALLPLPRAAALAAVPAPIGRLDFATRRVEWAAAPFATVRLVAEEVRREDVAPLPAAAFHASRDRYQPRILGAVFESVDYRSPRRGLGVVGPPSRPDERLLIDTGARIVDLRLRGFLPNDPRPLRVHSALRDDGGITVLASFVSEEAEVETRTLARLRLDPEGRLLERAIAELPPLERSARSVDTLVLDAKSSSDGGLAFVLHHATGGRSSPQYRIRLVPAGPPAEAAPGLPASPAVR